jgi:hypothetical protein
MKGEAPPRELETYQKQCFRCDERTMAVTVFETFTDEHRVLINVGQCPCGHEHVGRAYYRLQTSQ